MMRAFEAGLPLRRRKERGLSLIEVTMVLIITSAFVYFIGGMLSNSVTAYTKTTDVLAARAQLNFAMERISRELREIAVTYTPTTAWVASPGGTPPSFNITTPASPAASNTIVFVKNDGTTVTIGPSGSVVNLSYGATSGKLADIAASSDISFTFSNRATTPAAASSYSIFALGSIEFTLTVTVKGVTATGTTRVAPRGSSAT